MKNYKGYLIDLDGTMYKGSESIEAASDFVKKLRDQQIPYLLLQTIPQGHQHRLLIS